MPISEMEGKLNGYAVLLNYRFMNLCVKAEPASLLPINVMNEEGELVNFEDVANAMFVDKYTFEIVPNSQDLLFQIDDRIEIGFFFLYDQCLKILVGIHLAQLF